MSHALCPGSFDPPTVGHIEIIERAAKLFDRVTVAVIRNSTKNATLTSEERVDFLKDLLQTTKKLTSFHSMDFWLTAPKVLVPTLSLRVFALFRTSTTNSKWLKPTALFRTSKPSF